LRVREGERVRVVLTNELPDPTSIHWHGLPVPNAMDGVPGLTQAPVMPGESFTYEFDAAPAGTYFYHPHVGLQLDRGLYGALIIEPAAEPLLASRPDREYVLVLDDWLTIEPEAALAQMLGRGGMGGMMGGGSEPPYAGHLVNGRLTAGSIALTAARGERVKLRIINASSATTHRVGLDGHQLVVTHADGQAVRPVAVDSLVIGMGERYDVVVQAMNPGVWALLAGPVDSVVPGVVVPFAYAGSGERLRPVAVWPSGLVRGRTLQYTDLAPEGPADPAIRPSVNLDLVLGGGMMSGTRWTINGQAYPGADALRIEAARTVRLSFRNTTMMRHPMHLHGHFFRLVRASGVALAGIEKDTVLVEPMQQVEVDFTADNPGRWFLHCHHLYHMELGMARVIEY
jgi:FtsP/CotA-like multicopper oxidase with cupredoxin domain